MGEPGGSNVPSLADESIVCAGGTRGTETSKYPEEKKEKSISLVVASEEERGQTGRLRRAGVEGHQREAEGEQKSVGKRRPERVTAPYAKLEADRWYQSTAGHEESRGKPGGPPPKPKNNQ